MIVPLANKVLSLQIKSLLLGTLHAKPNEMALHVKSDVCTQSTSFFLLYMQSRMR